MKELAQFRLFSFYLGHVKSEVWKYKTTEYTKFAQFQCIFFAIFKIDKVKLSLSFLKNFRQIVTEWKQNVEQIQFPKSQPAKKVLNSDLATLLGHHTYIWSTYWRLMSGTEC